MQHKDNSILERMTDYCNEYLRDKRELPSTRHLAKVLNISKSSAQRYLVAVREGDRLTVQNKMSNDREMTPVYDGTGPCGIPDYQDGNVAEYVILPESLFGKGPKFIVRASGNSMIDAGINDGDMLVFRVQSNAEDGDIVAALVSGGNTVKTLCHDSEGHPYLHPENKEYDDIVIHEGDSFAIQGVLACALKRYSTH